MTFEEFLIEEGSYNSGDIESLRKDPQFTFAYAFMPIDEGYDYWVNDIEILNEMYDSLPFDPAYVPKIVLDYALSPLGKDLEDFK